MRDTFPYTWISRSCIADNHAQKVALKVPKRQIPSSHRRKPTKKIAKTKLDNQLLAAFGCQLHTMDSDLEEREVDR
jgi:hypothetical protein